MLQKCTKMLQKLQLRAVTPPGAGSGTVAPRRRARRTLGPRAATLCRPQTLFWPQMMASKRTSILLYFFSGVLKVQVARQSRAATCSTVLYFFLLYSTVFISTNLSTKATIASRLPYNCEQKIYKKIYNCEPQNLQRGTGLATGPR